MESSGEFSRLTPEDFTPRAKTAMEMALAEAAMMQHGYVGTEHILMAVLRDDSSVAVRLIVALGARPDELFGDIAKAVGAPTAQTTAGGERLGKAPAAKGGGKTPTLDQFGRDLTKQAKEGRLDPVIGRAAEIEPKTTPASSANPAWAKPLSQKAWPKKSPPMKSRSSCGASAWSRWI